MKIAVAGDSAGCQLAGMLASYLKTRPAMEVADLSSADNNPGEYYANIADRLAQAILAGQFERGILCCGTGVGMAISANKVPGIRAAQTHDAFSAVRAAKSNDAHIITIGARVIGPELAKNIVDAWLASEFDPKGPSADNVDAISELDSRYRRPNG